MGEATKKTTKSFPSLKLQLVIKSGEAKIGYKTTVKSLKSGKCQFIILSKKNCPLLRQYEIEYLASLSKMEITDFHHYNGSSKKLGRACGKRALRVSSLSVNDPGDSDFIEMFDCNFKIL